MASERPVDKAFYEAMTHDQLVARCKVAEDTLTLIGWSSIPFGQIEGSDRCQAAEQMWSIWAGMVGPDFTGPGAHPDLVAMEPMLAETRRRIRATTLARIEQMIDNSKGES
jgi:hypothetical protein